MLYCVKMKVLGSEKSNGKQYRDSREMDILLLITQNGYYHLDLYLY